jgi:hypothetical protein
MAGGSEIAIGVLFYRIAEGPSAKNRPEPEILLKAIMLKYRTCKNLPEKRL